MIVEVKKINVMTVMVMETQMMTAPQSLPAKTHFSPQELLFGDFAVDSI